MLRFVLLPLLVTAAFGFATGPPWKMCALMLPKHAGLQQQRGEAPFSVFVQQLSYAPGEHINIVLRTKPGGPAFKGFLLGAHALNGDTEAVVGQFVALPKGSRGLSWYAEQQGAPNCVSHDSPAPKQEMTFKWQAPSDHRGDVIFVAAFVREFSVFWANVSSAPLRSISREPLPSFPSAVQPGFRPLDLQACGKSKGCILYPRGCKPVDCEVAVAFSSEENGVEFEISAASAGFVSLGISADRRMGHDETFSCTISQDRKHVSVQHGYNAGHTNERHRILNVTDIQVARLSKTVLCRFLRPFDLSLTLVTVDKDNNGTFSSVSFSLNNSWYAFLAVGKLYEGSEVLHKHALMPIVSLQKVDFLSTEIVYASALPELVKLHGSFMLIAWMLCAGTGMVLAVNFKVLFSRQACGVALWFQLHRGLMALTAACTFTGLVLIFVALGRWESRAVTHGAVGLCTICLMGAQVVAGLTRPSMDSPRRVLFIWIHRLLGYGLHLFAAVTVLLAFFLPYLPPTLRAYNVVTVASWIAFQVAWMAIFRLLRFYAERRQDNSLKVIARGGVQAETQDVNSGQDHKMLIFAFVLYCITAVAFFSVCLAFIIQF